jgi:hypothetical protein
LQGKLGKSARGCAECQEHQYSRDPPAPPAEEHSTPATTTTTSSNSSTGGSQGNQRVLHVSAHLCEWFTLAHATIWLSPALDAMPCKDQCSKCLTQAQRQHWAKRPLIKKIMHCHRSMQRGLHTRGPVRTIQCPPSALAMQHQLQEGRCACCWSVGVDRKRRGPQSAPGGPQSTGPVGGGQYKASSSSLQAAGDCPGPSQGRRT